jgi:HlyD family secretion protein
VQGVDGAFAATIRSLRSDPAFTPYFALTGDDASRLAYRAELVLEGDAAKKLPAGLPVQAECGAHGG